MIYSGKRLSEIQTKLCLAWFIDRDTVPHTTAHRYRIFGNISINAGKEAEVNLENEPALVRKHRLRLH